MTWQLLNLWLQELGYEMTTIAALSIMGLPYYGRFLFIPLLEKCAFLTKWHHNHWLGVLSCSSAIVGVGGLTLSYLLTQKLLPSPLLLIGIGLVINIAGICFEKALALYKMECSSEEERSLQIFQEKIGLKFGRLLDQALALMLAWYVGWVIPFSLFSGLFLAYSVTVAVTTTGPEHRCDASIKERSWSPHALLALALDEWPFLFFVFFISLSDQVTAYFLMLFLKDIGMNYLQIAQLAKIAGAINISIGAWAAYKLSKPNNEASLLFYCSVAHLLSLMLLGYSNSIFFLWGIFFIKNVTLGAKIFLLSSFKNNYIAQKNLSLSQRRSLFFLASIIKAAGLSFCMAFGLIYQQISIPLFFVFVGLLSVPGLVMLKNLSTSQGPVLRLS